MYNDLNNKFDSLAIHMKKIELQHSYEENWVAECLECGGYQTRDWLIFQENLRWILELTAMLCQL